MNWLWKFQYALFKQDNGLSMQHREQIEKHWKMLKLVTEDIFDSPVYRSSSSDKIGNI